MMKHLFTETLAVERSFPSIHPLKDHSQVKPGSREHSSLVLSPDPEPPKMGGCSAETSEPAHQKITLYVKA